MRSVRALAPVRIDLAGGTLDLWPLSLCVPGDAWTIGVALDLPVEAAVRPREDGRLVLRSEDLGLEATYDDVDALAAATAAGACPLPLLAWAIPHALGADARAGLELATRAGPPPGSGLGTSSALLCAVLGALRAAAGQPWTPRGLQPLAQDLETMLMRTPTGYQDYYPPLLGGCVALRRAPGRFDADSVAVDLDRLAARLRLVHTGQPHVSGLTNWGVLRAYLDAEEGTVAALHRIGEHARACARALRGGDLDAALEHVLADGHHRRRMAPGVSTPAIEAIDAAVRDAGALGTKICGAGGGGCVLVVLPDDPAVGEAVDAALAGGEGLQLPVRLTAEGLCVEDTPAAASGEPLRP